MSIKYIMRGTGAAIREAARFTKLSVLHAASELCLVHPYSGDPIQLVAATVSLVLAKGIDRVIAVIPTRQHRRVWEFVDNHRAAQR